jgi:hypothetical protein
VSLLEIHDHQFATNERQDQFWISVEVWVYSNIEK